MKVKHFLSGATLLSAALLLNAPLSAAVESDVVGYATIDCTRGFSMVSIPFEELGSSAQNGIAIQEIKGDLFQSDRTSTDALMLLDPSTKNYVTYNYRSNGWVKEGETEPTTDYIKPGMGVFFSKTRSDGSMLVSGRVVRDTEVSCGLVRGYNLVSNPYPSPLKIADISGDVSAHDSRPNQADQIMILDPVTKNYTTYQLRKATGWTKEGESTTTTDVIGAYEGFVYIKALKDGSLTFERPL